MLKAVSNYLRKAKECLDIVSLQSMLVNNDPEVRSELEGTLTVLEATLNRGKSSLTEWRASRDWRGLAPGRRIS